MWCLITVKNYCHFFTITWFDMIKLYIWGCDSNTYIVLVWQNTVTEWIGKLNFPEKESKDLENQLKDNQIQIKLIGTTWEVYQSNFPQRRIACPKPVTLGLKSVGELKPIYYYDIFPLKTAFQSSGIFKRDIEVEVWYFTWNVKIEYWLRPDEWGD